MAGIIGALVGARPALRDFLTASAIVAGCTLMLGAFVFRVFLHPEWTAEEATGALWPYYAGGGAALVTGWIIDR